MKAIAVKPGVKNSAHLVDMPKPSVVEIANGRGVLEVWKVVSSTCGAPNWLPVPQKLASASRSASVTGWVTGTLPMRSKLKNETGVYDDPFRKARTRLDDDGALGARRRTSAGEELAALAQSFDPGPRRSLRFRGGRVVDDPGVRQHGLPYVGRGQALRRLRPLARRRASTFCPFLVDMRRRKP